MKTKKELKGLFTSFKGLKKLKKIIEHKECTDISCSKVEDEIKNAGKEICFKNKLSDFNKEEDSMKLKNIEIKENIIKAGVFIKVKDLKLVGVCYEDMLDVITHKDFKKFIKTLKMTELYHHTFHVWINVYKDGKKLISWQKIYEDIIERESENMFSRYEDGKIEEIY